MTSCCRALVGFLVLSAIVLNLGCRKSAPSPEAGGEKPTVPALAGLEKLAIAPSVSVSQVIGAEGGTLTSPDGGKLVVPPGVFRDPTKLQVSTVNLNLPAMAFDVKEARAFVMSTAGETGKLSQPVVLEISKPSAAVTVMELSDGSWQVRKVPAGATTRIEITHFSDPTFGLVEWFSGTNLQLNQALAEADNSKDPIKYQRTKIEKGTGDVKAFYGVGESGGRSVHDNCAEIQAMLSATASPGQYQVPDNPGPGASTLALFLHSADVPKAFGGVWYDMVKGSQDQIASALTSQSAELTPAQFLKICIDANGGNVYLGVLAAHNYLKDITYRGRDSYDGGYGMPADAAAAARHLRSWRPNSNISEGGYYDKMGPIYHLFAAMTAELWGFHGIRGRKLTVSFTATSDLICNPADVANVLPPSCCAVRIYPYKQNLKAMQALSDKSCALLEKTFQEYGYSIVACHNDYERKQIGYFDESNAVLVSLSLPAGVRKGVVSRLCASGL